MTICVCFVTKVQQWQQIYVIELENALETEHSSLDKMLRVKLFLSRNACL